jgi:hypothetical protein
MATPLKPSSAVNLRREAKAMLTAAKDAERNVARYTSPPDADGIKLVTMQLKMLQRQVAEVLAGVEGIK